ncbi:MAG: RNA methyltransferase [Planctomycetaceae bacterium]|nr:RNA methyltransferase [Planctomycetaceae bacterium]
MAYDETLADRIRECLPRRSNAASKRMFGGIAFLINGNMLVGVWKDSLIARLGPEAGDAALLEPHVRKFDVTGKPMKGWVLVEPDGLEDDDQLRGWLQRALAFVETLPAQ